MNITELARKLKIPTKELRQALPELGFDIGVRAIKVDDTLVDKITSAFEGKKKEEALLVSRDEVKRAPQEEKDLSADLSPEARKAKGGALAKAGEEQQIKEVKIPGSISVHDFAEKLSLPINKVMAELMSNGIMATINEEIDFETASIIAEDLGFKAEKGGKDAEGSKNQTNKDKLKKLLKEQKKTNLKSRPPVVVVMGHVDHGKTSLLDVIRETNVVAGEAGAITQHIGAYQVEKKNRKITFIDTPGHEAFKSMRARGGGVADIAVLVIAADDNIQPQTLESIRVIEQEKLPFVVAINKIDKLEADIDKIKTSLAELNLNSEDWGGKTICVPVSATKKQGIDELLEMILLIADMEKENLKSDFKGPALGTVIESHKDKNEGPVATVLIQAGTARLGDQFTIGSTYGKIRALKDYKGSKLDSATPGTPVRMLGLKSTPQVGDILEVITDPKELKNKIKAGTVKKSTKLNLGRGIVEKAKAEEGIEIKNLNIVLRADVVGSLEAVVEVVEEIKHEEINLNITKKALGNVTESDIIQAETSEVTDKSLVIGFNVALNPGVKNLAQEKGVNIKTYKVIYELIDDVKKNLEELLSLERIRHDVAKLEVLKIFRTETDAVILGGRVTKGKLATNLLTDILHEEKLIGAGKITELQSNKQKVTEVKTGSECGLKIQTKAKIAEGDVLEFYRIEEKAKTL
ncbi:translation initiation factor IF-2 [Candidatus Falkowbacteria bacterium]|nr:translation initiation factor IF-2 [Candidatus Falkowbacteria bacterium]